MKAGRSRVEEALHVILPPLVRIHTSAMELEFLHVFSILPSQDNNIVISVAPPS